ncbi:unnamed protein product, partial [Polarella glacialis]
MLSPVPPALLRPVPLALLGVVSLVLLSWLVSLPLHRVRLKRDHRAEYIGPLQVWVEVLTRYPLCILLLGILVPVSLSFLGVRASGFTVDVDLDFAGYLAAELPSRFIQ